MYNVDMPVTPINALFEIIRIQTMASGAIRYTFETAENELDLMRTLAECRVRGALLETVMLPVEVKKAENDRKLQF